MTTALCPPLLDRSIVPLSELLAMWLDGQLYRVGESFAVADTPETPALRAAAFAREAPPAAIADRGTAAWIHGSRATPPSAPQVCVTPDRRGARIPPWYDSRQRRLESGDLVSVSGVPVTSALRTALDLLLGPQSFGWEDALEIRELVRLGGSGTDELARRLEAPRLPFAERAKNRLALVRRVRPLSAGQPPLTRYTS